MKLIISKVWTMMTEKASNAKQDDKRTRTTKEIGRFGHYMARHIYQGYLRKSGMWVTPCFSNSTQILLYSRPNDRFMANPSNLMVGMVGNILLFFLFFFHSFQHFIKYSSLSQHFPYLQIQVIIFLFPLQLVIHCVVNST